MITPEEALGQIYAMRESVANGWVPNPDQEIALAMADLYEFVLAARIVYEDVDFVGEPCH